jgi:hypothetical protein
LKYNGAYVITQVANIIDFQINNLNCPTSETVIWVDLELSCLSSYPPPGNNYNLIRKQKIKIIIIKEPNPLLNLTFNNSCATNPKTGLFTGFINLNANGNFTNGNNLYLKTTNGSNTCNTNPSKLTNLTTITNTISNDTFYTCNSNTTYTVELIYKNIGLSGNSIIYTIPSGTYGWTNYIYTRPLRGGGCLNKAVIRKL